MNRWLRTGGWALLALAVLWVLAKVAGIVLGIVSWVVSAAVSLLVVALLLYLGYLAVSRLRGNGGSGNSRTDSRGREHERIFE